MNDRGVSGDDAELEVEFLGQLGDGQELVGIGLGEGHGQAQAPEAGLLQVLDGLDGEVEGPGQASDAVVGVGQAVKADGDAQTAVAS